MGDNDFPVTMAGSGGAPKGFLEQYLPKIKDTQKPQGYFREELEGERKYSQEGTDIPGFSVGQSYGQTEGGPVFNSTVAQMDEIPLFPMQQGQFSDYVRGRSDRSRPEVPISPELKQMIKNFRNKYSHLFV